MTKPSDIKIKIGEDILKPMKSAVYQERTIVIMVKNIARVSERIGFDLAKSYQDNSEKKIVYKKAKAIINIGKDLKIIFWRPDLNSARIDGLLFHELILMEFYSSLRISEQDAAAIAEHQLRSNGQAFGFKPKSQTIVDDERVIQYLKEVIDKI